MLRHDEWRSRIHIEASIVLREMPQYRLQEYSDYACFTGWQGNSRDNNKYQLELRLSRSYPDVKPKLYVINPNILHKQFYFETINEQGSRHAWHTSSNGPNGCVQICHSSTGWDASQTCVGVLLRGIIWLEAYAEYLQTGRTIARIIDDWIKQSTVTNIFNIERRLGI